MLGRKKKTGAQIAREITENITFKVNRVGKSSLPLRFICISCIVIFSFSICFGFYGLASRMSDISKKEQNIEKLRNDLQNKENELEKKQELKEKLESDPWTIEAVARSHGMSKKGEKIFYFLD